MTSAIRRLDREWKKLRAPLTGTKIRKTAVSDAETAGSDAETAVSGSETAVSASEAAGSAFETFFSMPNKVRKYTGTKMSVNGAQRT